MSTQMVGEEAAQATSPRHWIGLVMVYLLIPLVLLECGGDLGWWQGWLYSVVVLAQMQRCVRNVAAPKE